MIARVFYRNKLLRLRGQTEEYDPHTNELALEKTMNPLQPEAFDQDLIDALMNQPECTSHNSSVCSTPNANPVSPAPSSTTHRSTLSLT